MTPETNWPTSCTPSEVVYRGYDSHIYALYLEIRLQSNSWVEAWQWADLSAITGSPAAKSSPHQWPVWQKTWSQVLAMVRSHQVSPVGIQ